MIHRGPNDAGADIICLGENTVGIAHRRLSIIDLSDNGHQPMKSEDQSVEIVFNGEIYNYRELRDELKEYHFKSESDTEIIIAAYKRWGIDFIRRCNGMFAIALLDRSKDIIYLIRDRLGQKPLYYYHKGDDIVFASELKAIMEYPGIELYINRAVLGRYLVKNCILSPDTIFENVSKVCPGEIVEIDNFQIKKSSFWNVNEAYLRKKDTYPYGYKRAIMDVEKALEDATRYRLISDVPIGILLSGGYDSTIVTALASRISNNKINTYSIGITDIPKINEAEHAKKVAGYLGTEHHEYYISGEDMKKLVKEIPTYFDEPFADSSQIATMLVFKLAGQDVKVILAGDGGDELFAGYPIYHTEKFAQVIYPFARAIERIFGRFIKKNTVPGYIVKILGETHENKTQFNYQNRIDTVKKMLPYSKDENYDEITIPAKKWSIRRMLLDTQTYLIDDILCKVDRASMAYSTEARSPFMDVNVIELALSLPHRYKLKGRKTKRLLKDMAWNIVPKELMERPKQGFEVPIEAWMKTSLRKELIEYSRAAYLRQQGIFNPHETETIIDVYLASDNADKPGNITMVVWSFYVFQIWYIKYRENIKAVLNR